MDRLSNMHTRFLGLLVILAGVVVLLVFWARGTDPVETLPAARRGHRVLAGSDEAPLVPEHTALEVALPVVSEAAISPAEPTGPRTLDGTVLDRFGQAVEGERIWLLPPDQGHPPTTAVRGDFLTCTTSSKGVFSLTLPDQGSYRLAVGSPGQPRVPPSEAKALVGRPRARVVVPGGTAVHVQFDAFPETDAALSLEVTALLGGDSGEGRRIDRREGDPNRGGRGGGGRDSGRRRDRGGERARRVSFSQDPTDDGLQDQAGGRNRRPGGKATAIVDGVGAAGFLLANEAVRSRLGPLQFNLARHGGWRYAVSNLDPEKLAERLGGHFDAVLVDAPCSGQSMVARGKQRATGFGHKSVSLNAKRQTRILRAAAKLVQPGGRLVYSTCTYSWVENEAQIEAVLGDEARRWQAEEVPGLEAFLANGPAPEACYRLWPDRHGCTGAFAARLRNQEDHITIGQFTTCEWRHRIERERRALAEIPWSEWGRWQGETVLKIDGRLCRALPDDRLDHASFAHHLGKCADTAYRKGRSWFPSYALAMRRDDAFVPTQRHALSHEEARAYLAGHPVSCGTNGWCVCTFEGRPLGWGKASHGAMANHLPATARLHIE